MHIKGINRKVIRGEFKRLEDLFKRQLRAIAEGDDVLQKHQAQREGKGRIETWELRFIFAFMNRKRCFWFMLLEWWTCVSTLRTL